jgi:hypothetical protein
LNLDFVPALLFFKTTFVFGENPFLNPKSQLTKKIIKNEPEFYSVVSIKGTGGNKRTGWAELFHLLHEKRVQGGAKMFLLHEK